MSPASPLMPWLAVEQFIYKPLEDHSAELKLVGRLDGNLGAPAGAMLIVQDGRSSSAHPPLAVTGCEPAGERLSAGLLWRASFAVPLEVVEYPRAAFMLIADHRVALALPVPARTIDVVASASGVKGDKRLRGARIRRHFVALGAGLAIAAGASSGVGVAAAGAITGQPADSATTTTVPTSAPTPSTTSTTTTSSPPPSTTSTTATPAVTPPSVLDCKSAVPPTNVSSGAGSHHCRAPGSSRDRPARHSGHHRHRASHSDATATDRTAAHGDHSRATGHKDRSGMEHAHPSHHHHHSLRGGGAAPERGPAAAGAPETPASTVAGVSAPLVASPWTMGLNPDPFESAELGRLSSLLAGGNQPPAFLIPIYKAAGRRYHVPWKILAAINSIETSYGRNLSVSSAGAIGWMQFMPGTWRMYGVVADGRGRPNPFNPTDAIFTAARYLAASGARHNLRRAIFAYNHSDWYVQAVLLKAEAIVDRTTSLRHRKGYSLPLAPPYMHQLGRTDDGVDIETAPDGALVYSITPGLVTAVADDPGGFGPNYPVIVATKGPLTGKVIYYGHVALSLVRPGERVSAGQPIAVMGHTGDAASLGHGHIEVGFSNADGDPLDQHGVEAWTPAGDEMRRLLVELSALCGIRNS